MTLSGQVTDTADDPSSLCGEHFMWCHVSNLPLETKRGLWQHNISPGSSADISVRLSWVAESACCVEL